MSSARELFKMLQGDPHRYWRGFTDFSARFAGVLCIGGGIWAGLRWVVTGQKPEDMDSLSKRLKVCESGITQCRKEIRDGNIEVQKGFSRLFDESAAREAALMKKVKELRAREQALKKELADERASWIFSKLWGKSKVE